MKKITRNTLTSSRPFNYISHFLNNCWLALIAVLFIIPACDNPNLSNFKTPLKNVSYDSRYSDTFTLIPRTELIDSIPAYNFTKDLIGCYSDRITGKTVASVYFNLQLPSATIKLPATVTVNSVILRIYYNGPGYYFGNLTELQTFNVHEITEKLDPDSTYYSSNTIDYDPKAVGTWRGLLDPYDTVLEIELSKEFGQKLLSGSNKQLTNNDSFQNFFKGLGVIPSDQVFMGAIVYFNLNNVKTRLSVYYNDSSVVVFPVNANSTRFSKFEHDYSGSLIETQISNPQTEFSELPLQPMSGTKISIKIPYLKKLIDSGLVAIQKAEIIFPIDMNSPYYAYTPKSLLLLKTDTLNNLISIIDRGETYYGGVLNTSKTAYSFIITRHLQQLLEEYKNYPDYVEKYTLNLIIPSDNPITAAPVILQNIDANGNKVVKLKIWYTRL